MKAKPKFIVPIYGRPIRKIVPNQNPTPKPSGQFPYTLPLTLS